MALAFLGLMSWRCRMVMELREETGDGTLTSIDADVLLHVFTFGLTGGAGTRPAEIINSFTVPRRTIRDALARWERLGYVMREDGLYYPTAATARLFNDRYEDRVRLVGKICDAFADFQAAVGRGTP